MLEFQKLTIRNFLSVGNIEQVINLNRNGITLILGENLDQPQGENSARNGVGKTTILNAISYALYGNTISDIKRISNVVNNVNEKNCFVTLEFIKNGHYYRIERGQKPSILRWIVDGSLAASDNAKEMVGNQQGDSRNTQHEINQVVGFALEMFMHIIAMNTYSLPFLQLSAGKQREIIEQILGILVLSEKSEKLAEMMKYSKKQIELEETKLEAQKEANARVQLSIDDIELKSTLWNKSHIATLERLNNDISSFAGIDFDSELALYDALDVYNTTYNTLEQNLRSAVDLQNSLQRDERRLDIEKVSLKSKQISTNEVDRLESDLYRYQQELDNVDNSITTKIAETTTWYDKKRQQIEDAAAKSILSEEKTHNHTITLLDNKISDISLHLTQFTNELDDPNTLACSTCGQPLHDEEHKASILTSIQGKIDSLNDEIIQYTAAKKLAKNDFANTIEMINKQANEDLDKNRVAKDNEISTLSNSVTDAKVLLETKISTVKENIEEVKRRNATETENIGKQIDDLVSELSEIRSNLDLVNLEIQRISDEIAHMGSKPTPLFPTRNEAYAAKSLKEQLERDILVEQEKQNPYAEQVETLKKNLIVPSYDILNEYSRLLDHQKFLKELLSDKKSFIRKRIIDQNIAFLNSRLSQYLTKVGLPHQVLFQNDLSVIITQFGKELDVGNLSRGESTRLSISLSWAFRDVWESMNGSVNLLFLDELLDQGMDLAGVDKAFDVLKEFGLKRSKSVFLITHREELHSRAENVLIVRKENKFTTFEEKNA